VGGAFVRHDFDLDLFSASKTDWMPNSWVLGFGTKQVETTVGLDQAMKRQP
jgi:hypothetical protein